MLQLTIFSADRTEFVISRHGFSIDGLTGLGAFWMTMPIYIWNTYYSQTRHFHGKYKILRKVRLHQEAPQLLHCIYKKNWKQVKRSIFFHKFIAANCTGYCKLQCNANHSILHYACQFRSTVSSISKTNTSVENNYYGALGNRKEAKKVFFIYHSDDVIYELMTTSFR